MDTTRYPIGLQVFENVRKERCVYADKTGYVYQLAKSPSRTYFLSRPRRFGKSLLLSTFDAYFSGRKDLFEGLAIYELEKDWEAFPVLRFDFSRAEADSPESLKKFISNRLHEFETEYSINDTAHISEVGDRFGTLIERISKSTGKRVVILIDEYDKGIHEVMGNADRLEANQKVLRPFFSQIKSQEEYIRFCFITGVARFRNYTLFSGFNNPDDISMTPKYAGICGITKEELLSNFREGIMALSEEVGRTYEQTLELLRQKYDGYRFTTSNVLVFNPFSIINCLNKQMLEDYWITSGTPKVFVDYLSKSNFQILELEQLWVSKKQMESTYSTEDPIPLLFQTGYLTIADVRYERYRLRIPNGEVRSALVDELIPKCMGISQTQFNSAYADILHFINHGDVDGFMTILQSLVANIPYQEMDLPNIEKTYHLVIYELFLILGINARSEVSMSGGRIDIVVETLDYVYVIEFKNGGTVEEALHQIDERGYNLPWRADGRKVCKIGAVFSPKTRTIAQWKSEE